MSKLEVFLLDPKATPPTRNLPDDAGVDLYALENVYIPVGQTALVKTGVAIRVPRGRVGLVRERSSIGKKGLKVAGGVIDAGYSGDISVLVMNVSNVDTSNLYVKDLNRPDLDFREFGYNIKAGDRIAQILIIPVDTNPIEVVDTLWTSERGGKGFGSSGT